MPTPSVPSAPQLGCLGNGISSETQEECWEQGAGEGEGPREEQGQRCCPLNGRDLPLWARGELVGLALLTWPAESLQTFCSVLQAQG